MRCSMRGCLFHILGPLSRQVQGLAQVLGLGKKQGLGLD